MPAAAKRAACVRTLRRKPSTSCSVVAQQVTQRSSSPGRILPVSAPMSQNHHVMYGEYQYDIEYVVVFKKYRYFIYDLNRAYDIL